MTKILEGKRVVLGVSGSIAAYKMANVASMLVKLGADVHVIMTKNAENFITPITFETLTGNKCMTDSFETHPDFSVAHISLGQTADVMLVAPASANIIAKMANGIADDMLSTTVVAATCKIIVSPAMNTKMYDNPITQDNLKKLEHYGFELIEPDSGVLACRDEGRGKLPKEETLVNAILREAAFEKDLEGKRILVSAGATMEAIDPVRFITNHSSGKMGYAIAKMALLRGADVTLVSANSTEVPFDGINVIRVKSAQEMFDEIVKIHKDMDYIIKAAAVSDYTPKTVSSVKIKKGEGDSSIELKRTKDILDYLGHNRSDGQVVCGFAMETNDLIANASKKLEKKNADMIVANSLSEKGAGFKNDTNKVTFLTKKGNEELELMSKEEVAVKLLDRLKMIETERKNEE